MDFKPWGPLINNPFLQEGANVVDLDEDENMNILLLNSSL